GYLVPPVRRGGYPSVERAADRLALPAAVSVTRRPLLEGQGQPEVLPVERVGVPPHHVDVSHPQHVRPRLEEVGTVDVPEQDLGRVVDVAGELPPEPAHDCEVMTQPDVHGVRPLLVPPPVRLDVVVGRVDPGALDVAVGVHVDARHVVHGHTLQPQLAQRQSAAEFLLPVGTNRRGHGAGVRVSPPLHDAVEVGEELTEARGDVTRDVTPAPAAGASSSTARSDGGNVAEVARDDDAGPCLAVGAVSVEGVAYVEHPAHRGGVARRPTRGGGGRVRRALSLIAVRAEDSGRARRRGRGRRFPFAVRDASRPLSSSSSPSSHSPAGGGAGEPHGRWTTWPPRARRPSPSAGSSLTLNTSHLRSPCRLSRNDARDDGSFPLRRSRLPFLAALPSSSFPGASGDRGGAIPAMRGVT
ncbi:hypothetical protein THAOC_16841, partial [Thalassiosira oceanica]